MILRIFDAFFLQNCICWILFGTLTIIFDVLEEIIGKIIESRYIGICPIIDKIIDIGRRLPQIIGDFRELSAKLSISKMTGELSKIYRYRKKWLIAHPYLCVLSGGYFNHVGNSILWSNIWISATHGCYGQFSGQRILQNVKSSGNGVFWALLKIFHTFYGCAGGYAGNI